MLHEMGSILLERYRLEGLIGQGGMGAVYRALDIDTGLQVAVKQLRQDAEAGFDNREMMLRFDGEAQLLRTLNHPRIPKMLDSFRIDDNGYYVMEFIEGKSLDQVRRESKEQGKRFSEETLVQYALQILDVLDYLHNLPKPLLHRDVKPQNIIVRAQDAELFLVDFGLAREGGGSATTKTLVGTLGYAPLEQVKGHPEPRSDLYALGATMWHTLVGEQPSPFDIPPLLTARNDVHPALAEVVDRACQDNVNRRYANARKMEMALRQALAAMTGQAGDSRFEQLYLEETPEVVYSGAPLSAKEFLLRAGLASASLLLLMVVVYRAKKLIQAPQPSPTVATAARTATPGIDSTPEMPGRPQIPAPPPYHPLGANGSIRLQPVTPEMTNFFSHIPGWRLSGFVGTPQSGSLRAPAGGAAGLLWQHEGAANLRRLRLVVTRSGPPTSFQLGLHQGQTLVVGLASHLEGREYASALQGGGLVSQVLRRPWNTGGSDIFDLTVDQQGWQLREGSSGASVRLAAPATPIDGIQLLIPPAQEGQQLNVNAIEVGL